VGFLSIFFSSSQYFLKIKAMNTSKTVKTFLSALLVSSVGLATVRTSPATANTWLAQVEGQLIMAARALGLGGYEPTHTPQIGQLRDDAYRNLGINLQQGETYDFVGVCDSDCGDLDLRLLDGNGNLIDTDEEYDDNPMVSVTPILSGSFVVQVGMPNCSASSCYYGVGAFGR
jgi:hypothetical protein